MKVSDVGSIRDAAAVRRKRKTEATGDFASHLEEAAQAGTAGGVDTAGVSQVGAVLAAQEEVPDATEQRSRGLLRQYGDDVLGHLDAVRHGLLVGAVPKEKLAALAYRMRQKRVACADPRLQEIIGEIELRAEVEIAKLTREP